VGLVDGSAAGRDDESGAMIREVTMNDVLTMDEIKARYAPDWVLIGEPQTDEKLGVLAGKVLFHGPDRSEVCRKAMEYPPGRYALEFLGTFPEDLVLVL
jgi:hypothetical protein